MRGESAVARHDRMVREEREQAERIRSDGGGGADLWRPIARRFGVGGMDDPATVDALATLAGPEATVIDVGAGGGRITIPLAQRVGEVVAVEPSPGMREVLADGITQAGAANVRIVAARWEEAEVEPADLVFASHVTYSVASIAPFLRKLDATARRIAALVVFTDHPTYAAAPFWEYVYGEERLRLPCRDEVVAAVRELGGEPRFVELPSQPPRSYGSPDEAFEELRARLFIGRGDPLEERLREAITTLTVERDGAWWVRDAQPNERSVVWWESGSMQRAAHA
jgi:SAM-dependent methyltransferase